MYNRHPADARYEAQRRERVKQVLVRFDRDEHTKLVAAASKSDETVSDYIKTAVRQRILHEEVLKHHKMLYNKMAQRMIEQHIKYDDTLEQEQGGG